MKLLTQKTNYECKTGTISEIWVKLLLSGWGLKIQSGSKYRTFKYQTHSKAGFFEGRMLNIRYWNGSPVFKWSTIGITDYLQSDLIWTIWIPDTSDIRIPTLLNLAQKKYCRAILTMFTEEQFGKWKQLRTVLVFRLYNS